MGNVTEGTSTPPRKISETNSEQTVQIYENVVRRLKLSCAENEFPLSILHSPTHMSKRYRLIEVVNSPRRSDEFSEIVVHLICEHRPHLTRDDITKLFRDCCLFDLKQSLPEHDKWSTENIDSECFNSLTNMISTSETISMTQDKFYDWIRVHFPTLFYGFELWLRKNAILPIENKKFEDSLTSVSKNRSLMPMPNILNATWVWLLLHHLPITYLSADNTCTNLFERMTSVLSGRMWDHLYDSYRDGASLNRFQHHTFGYKAPTLVFFETSDNYLFCLCSDEEYRESPKHFGGIQTCFFQLKPVFKVVLEGPHIIFMNTKLRGLSALGLLVGRDHTHTYFSIDADFFNVKHLHGDVRLLGIDVWGAGGQKSADEQRDMHAWEGRQIEKSQKVKRSYEEEETILNMAGIETRHQQEQF